MAQELLRLENITKIYPNGFIANDRVSMRVNRGEIHALIGENGAGKTTLMKILFGLESHQEGKVYIDEKEVKIANPLDAIAKGVGMVHQHFMLVDELTVAENVVLGIEPGKGCVFDKKEAVRMTKEVSERFHLAVNPEALVRDVSVGVKQKIELLKALIRGVRVLILDEPTAVLTPQETRELFVQLKSLAAKGYGLIFISHKLDEIMELCNNVTVLRHGKVVGNGEIKDLSEKALSRLIVGREIKEKPDERECPLCGENVLTVRNCSYVDDIGKRHVDEISFGIRAGEIVGIAGIEGNGQKELSEMITGMASITAGNIEVNGQSIRGKEIDEIRKLGVAHISEDRMSCGCAAELSIFDNIASIYMNGNKHGKGFLLDRKDLNAYVDECIREFEIACDDCFSPVRMLSGGNIQKVVVAREFTSGANLIVANQPTRGIDVGTAALIHKLLYKYTREKNYAVLLISSDLNEILNTSDRLLVMRKGRFNAQFTQVSEVTDEVLGEYMLGVKKMTEEEMGDLF